MGNFHIRQSATFTAGRFPRYDQPSQPAPYRSSQNAPGPRLEVPDSWLQFQIQHQLVLPERPIYDRYAESHCRKIKTVRKQWGRWVALSYKRARSEVGDIRSALTELVAQGDITRILRRPSVEKRFGNLALMSGMEIGASGKPSADFLLGRFEPFQDQDKSDDGLMGRFAIVAEIEVKSTSFLQRALKDAADQFSRRKRFWSEDGVIIYPKDVGYRRFKTYFDPRAKIHQWLMLPHPDLPRLGKRIDDIYVIPLSLPVEVFREASRRIGRDTFSLGAKIPSESPTIDGMKRILSEAKAHETLIGFWPVGDLAAAKEQLAILKPSIESGDMTILDVGDHVLGISGSWFKQQDLRKWPT